MGRSKYLDKNTTGSVENLEKYFALGKHALDWYDDALAFCKELSIAYALPVQVVAAVTAVLSPANTWDHNMAATKLYCEAFGQGQEQPIVGGYGKNRDKAWRILTTQDVTLVSGIKVTSFYRNIMGYHHDVTVDRHAIRAWLGQESDFNGNGAQFPDSVYERCVDDYRELAQSHDLNPAQAQAAVWVGYRTVKQNRKRVNNG